MSYLALYRKYRPVDFEDFAGQTEITESLRYQVKSGTFGHSYLFNGIRGTGKTSMAKVFSKAINCLDPKEGNPCNQCASCLAFQNNGLMDVIEIDAASNNGVDDIRELRENSHFVPAYSKYKVYIIDEVQMLSKEAFNALLKTLEEPSKQVVFIMATTELHKIPETILSRCQRYTFRRIEDEAMVKRLEYVARCEGLHYQLGALRLLSEHAGGALRDALSLMEKTIALSQGNLTEEAVHKSLGLLGRERTHKLLSAMFSGQVDLAMGEVDILLKEGKEIGAVLEEMQEFLRALLIHKYIKHTDQLEKLLSFSMEKYVGVYEEVEAELIQEVIGLFDETHRKLRFSSMPRLALEMAIIQGAEKGHGMKTVQVRKVLDKRKIEKIEEEVAPPRDIPQDDVQMYWEKVLKHLRQGGSQQLFFLLSEGTVGEYKDETLKLEFPAGGDYYVKNLQQEENRKVLDASLRHVFGRPVRLLAHSEALKPAEVKPVQSELDMLKAFLGADADKLEIK